MSNRFKFTLNAKDGSTNKLRKENFLFLHIFCDLASVQIGLIALKFIAKV